jgi:hypothetical protein
MDPLWLLSGQPDAEGWTQLEIDARSKAIDVLLFDRDKWALARAPQPPGGYPGLTPSEPPDGLYLDNFGRPCYVVDAQEVHSGRAVIRALGAEAERLLEEVGDAAVALERLGRVY